MTVDRQRAPQVRDRKSAPKAPRVNLGPTSMERAARVAAAGIVPVRVPTIPPSDPDAEILNGFAETMSLRAAGYAAATEPTDDEARAQEPVWCTMPSTIGGVVARLALMTPDLDNNRWLDEVLSSAGIGALLGRNLELNDDARHVAQTIGHLIRIDWEQALAAYEAEEHALHTLNSLLEAIEREDENTVGADGLHRLQSAGDAAYTALRADSPALARLIRTLAPDGEAFRLKMQITVDEDAAHHILGTAEYLDRDFMHVMGRYAAAQAEG